MIRAIIFDCFGVLYVNTTHLYFSQFPDLYDELHDLNKQADHGFIDREAYITAVTKLTGVSREETLHAFSHEYAVNQPLIDYIKASLKPSYKIALLSNIGRGWMQDFFDEHQLHELFDVVVLSSDEGMTKPNPLIFERTAQRLGLSPDECLTVDDRQDNCNGARGAGMKALLYRADMPLERLRQSIESGGV